MNNKHGINITKLNLLLSQRIESEDNLGISIETPKNRYFITKLLAYGDISTVYEGYYIDNDSKKEVVIKVVCDPIDNDLIGREISSLKFLNADPDSNVLHLALLLDTFKTKDRNIGVVLQRFEGHTINEVRNHPLYLNGFSDYHTGWVLSRLLSVVGYAHNKGIIHCNIEPDHILINPALHNVGLIDWCYSSIDSQDFVANNIDYSPPEAFEEGRVIPLTSSDLYSLGKSMIFLLGGNIKNNTFPDSVEPRLQQFIQSFVLSSPYQRTRDAWRTYHQLEELRQEIWGAKKYVPADW
jgi:serine/threonine protein kinase